MTEAKELRPGNYIRMNNEILKVTRKEVVAYGTHSHSKTKLFVQGLFSKGERSFNLNHHDNVEIVDIMRKEGQVISKLPDKVQVMDAVSYETIDASAEDELMQELNEGDTVTFISFEGKTQILEKRQ
jgi:translation elongation factor P/translation initiation factor 5A